MATKHEAMTEHHFEHVRERNADGTPLRVRSSGKCQTWKTRPNEFRPPVKHGLKTSLAITETNAADWHVAGR